MAVAQPKQVALLGVNPASDPEWIANRERTLICAQQALQPSRGEGLLAGLLGLLGVFAVWKAT